MSLTLHFDPITWDALKARSSGAMERCAYSLIQEGLGVVHSFSVTDERCDLDSGHTFESMNFEAFRRPKKQAG